jgi:hypothetical protein
VGYRFEWERVEALTAVSERVRVRNRYRQITEKKRQGVNQKRRAPAPGRAGYPYGAPATVLSPPQTGTAEVQVHAGLRVQWVG